MSRESIFIGCSRESLPVARAVQVSLENDVESTIWDQGVFPPGQSTLASLVAATMTFDFALLVAHRDDLIESRGEKQWAPRDNVVFELGLFIGGLGPERTFLLYNRDQPVRIPTDLAGVTTMSYGTREDGNLQAAVAGPCEALRQRIASQGVRRERSMKLLNALELEAIALRMNQEGDYHGALRAAEIAVEKDPTSEPAHRWKIRALRMLGRYPAALAASEAALAVLPNRVEVMDDKGLILYSLKRDEDAITCLNTALSIAPDHVPSLWHRALALERLGMLQEALTDVQRAFEVGPGTGYSRRAGAAAARLRAELNKSHEHGARTVAYLANP